MDNITIKQMRYFEAVVAHQHFGNAAAACSISQPAISVQIRDLELAVGQKLFQREAKSVTLTTFGEIFAENVRPILQAVDDLGQLARSSRDALTGRVKLGIIPTVGPYILPAVVRSVAERFPQVDLMVRETQTSNLIDAVRKGELDAAVVALPISEPNLVEQALFEERFVLVRKTGTPAPRALNAETLREMKLLLLEEGHCFRDQALSFCGGSIARPSEMLDGSSLSTLVQMTASGLGVTLIPEMAIPLETGNADVTVTPFGDDGPRRTIGMVWRRNAPLAEHLEALSDAVAATV